MIKYKGNQISPAELENVLTTHPAVIEAFVTGVPDPVAGEVPKAYVVLNRPSPLFEITDHVAERVEPYQRIHMIERVCAIPRSATGELTSPPALRVLLTGGTRGLGRSYAEALTNAGASVLITGRDEVAAVETVKGIRERGGVADYALADLTDARALAHAADRAHEAFGGIDVLINNAGTAGPLGPLWEVSEHEWWQAMETNIRGTALATRVMLPRMLDQDVGRIITVVSRAGKTRWPFADAYSMSKATLISLTANLDGELRGSGITTVAFDPGLVDTGITRAHFDRGHTGDPWADKILDWMLRKRDNGDFTPLGTSARALVAVAAGAAEHLSGQYVTIDDLKCAHSHQPS
jgi:NAD(P)-dependent dehydrogenase (short-subunit alcohol dehydrogenase family)